jgi:hypothetical protein
LSVSELQITLVAPKAQAAEFFATAAPRIKHRLELRGFKTKVEPVNS